MARLTRAQQQERTRAAVLVAARQEFAERGFAEARIDRIAERAELTRGAVYSNFTGKRALYLAVLVDAVERARDAAEPPAASPDSVGQALGSFARVWLERLPFLGDTPGSGHLQLRSLSGVLDTEPARAALAELVRFEALLLALALEPRSAVRAGTVRPAGLALTLLHGAAGLAENAPGVGDPFDLARAAEHLGDIALGDTPEPPHLPYITPARSTATPWTPPGGLRDEITDGPVDLGADGVVAVLGVGRLSAAEDVMRSARPDDEVTIVVVTSDPAETGRLARLRIVDLVGCLRRVFPPDRLPRARVVLDDTGTVPAALGHPSPDDRTELAVRIRDGLITGHATGPGAGHAAARHHSPDPGPGSTRNSARWPRR
ncbi:MULTISPECIES: TetR/AcrR family transcriptional regulator [Streptomyces]|uniref:TetR/AcrR family transcriptional regulator n=1 Tax=Streptomyces TaxID=1883 RepID=UPI00163C5F04|nr:MULTISPECIES: TetR/AcrR family transcriptional regulator [Streptomyces]MBC2874267.1 TetR/AcrR family transcriptional regulator [Streptomyces sp. TYQ1024]UBI40302.1 TetR/AcrR family transcriptional regulator [Streptomyces mobaraensis]UKW32882.1 TetR/AcrR family transcriptional regulator [Streptomyces sp. TYQ1024]